MITRLNLGGPAQHVFILSRDLDPTRFNTTLVTGVPSAGEADMTPDVRAGGVEPIIVPTLGRQVRWFDDLRTFLRIVRLLRRQRPAIVHTHTAKAGAVGRVAAWICRVPVRIHTFHGHVFHGYFSGWKSRLYVLIERALAKLCDCIVVLSPRQRDEICDAFGVAPRDRTRIVPLGLELQRFSGVTRQQGGFRRELGIDAATPLLGVVGRLVPIKDHHLLLDVAAALRAAGTARGEQDRSPCFVIIGDGELRPDLERRCRELGLDGSVRFHGWRRDLERIYADLDVALLTSRNEGLPVSLIEAMAAGVAVVAADVGGVADLFGLESWPAQDRARGWCAAPFGILVGSREPTVWRDALADLFVRGKATRERCERAQRSVLERFSAHRLVADVEALYLELLDRKGLLSADPSRRAAASRIPQGAAAAPDEHPLPSRDR